MQSQYNVTLSTVGGLGPFTWTLSGGTLPPGISLSTGGVLSGTPPITDLDSSGNAKSYSFTVKVTDSQTPTAAYNTANLSITINPLPLVTTTSLPDGTIGLPYVGNLTNSGGLAPFTWSLTAGTLPAGLSVSGATISGTPTGTAACGTFPITVQVTDADSNTASANLQIVVTQKLGGNNAFSFNGFDNGQPFYAAGSFVGDCTGTITSGFIDQNGLAAQDVITKAPVTGTFSIATSGLGSLTLTYSGNTYNYGIAPSLNGDTKFILVDANHPTLYGSGVIKAQSLGSVTDVSSISGNYAMGFFGVDPANNRAAGAGAFKADTSGNLTNGVEDTNDNGTVGSQTAFTGTWALDSDFATSGRGTEILTVGTSTLHYAFYIVQPKGELIGLQTDLASGGASLSLVSLLQGLASITGGFTDASLNASAVMQLSGYTGGTSPSPDVQLGVGTFDGTGNITHYQTDENKGGTYQENTFTGTYNVASNGRVTVSGVGTGPQPVWYLVGPNQGFVIGTDGSVTEGLFEPQSGAPFSLAQFLLSYAGGTIQPVLPSVTNEVDSTFIPAPGGVIDIAADTSGPGGAQVGLPVLMLAYALGDDPNNTGMNTTGKILLTPLTGSPGPKEIVYMINAGATGGTGSPDLSHNKWASINITKADGTPDTNPRLSVLTSTHK